MVAARTVLCVMVIVEVVGGEIRVGMTPGARPAAPKAPTGNNPTAVTTADTRASRPALHRVDGLTVI